MSLSIFSRKSAGANNPPSVAQACVAKLRHMSDEEAILFVKNSAKSVGQSPAEFAKACLDTLKDTSADDALRQKLRPLVKEKSDLPTGVAERATLAVPSDSQLRHGLHISSYDPALQDSPESVFVNVSADRKDLTESSIVDRKNYQTTVFKRDQSACVVKHVLSHPNDSKALFSKYVNSGKSGPESRMDKLHGEIKKIEDPERRSELMFDFVGVCSDTSLLVNYALTHLQDAESLFVTHIAGDAAGFEFSLQRLSQDINALHYTDVNKLAPVLDRVLEGMAAKKGPEVAGVLIASHGFSADFSQVSAENALSDEAGLTQLSKDFSRGVSFTAPGGVSLETLPKEAKAFIGRFANQQSAAALVSGGALNISDKVTDLLAGSGFRLDGWNSETAGVSYQVAVDESGGVRLAIPTTIAIKPTVMSSVASIPICVATLEMSMLPVASGGYAYAVNVGFSFLPNPPSF
jgi:hypothetical protein